MAGIGPPKQPDALFIAKGNYRPSAKGEPDIARKIRFITSAPEPPKALNEIGARLWTSVLLEATAMPGYISAFDLIAFEQYCYNYQLMRAAQENLNKYGQVVKEAGQTKINPFFKTLQEATKVFIQLSDRFGFTPSMRTRIRIEQENERDELDDFKI